MLRPTRRLATRITLDAFKTQLSPLHGVVPHRKDGHTPKIALAVSGGVDSMCLAHLCSQVQKDDPKAFDFTAYIVDHRARPGSEVEARASAENIRRLGLHVKVLDVVWPEHHLPPLQRPDFESEARTLRYTVLGKALSGASAPAALLMAHHSDDQAETVFSRLLVGYTGLGLEGIKTPADMPENYGVYTVHQGQHPATDYANTQGFRFPVAGEGLQVYRPLLKYSKQDLIDTCMHDQVPWIEDASNSDKTLTIRNAVRHLLATDSLPHALRKRSLLKLTTRVSHRHQSHQERANELVGLMDIERFDFRTGMLHINLSRLVQYLSEQGHSDPASLKYLMPLIISIQMVLRFVTPEPFVSLVQAQRVSEQLFEASVPSFTGAGIMLRRNPKNPGSIHDWILWRQPVHPDASPTIRWTGSGTSPPHFQRWRLFDGRWWIRVAASQPVQARFLLPSDMTTLASDSGTTSRASLKTSLTHAAPGQNRFSIPVLVGFNGEQNILALPSLKLRTTFGVEAKLRYEVLYKHSRDLEHILPQVAKEGPTL